MMSFPHFLVMKGWLRLRRRSVRWLDRCMSAELDADQNLFPIIQGGIDLGLREQCINEMLKRDLRGYAIGGLCGGEDKVLSAK